MSSDRARYARPLAVGNDTRAMGSVGELGLRAGRPAPELHAVLDRGRREEPRAAFTTKQPSPAPSRMWARRSCAPIRERRGAALRPLPLEVGARSPSAEQAAPQAVE